MSAEQPSLQAWGRSVRTVLLATLLASSACVDRAALLGGEGPLGVADGEPPEDASVEEDADPGLGDALDDTAVSRTGLFVHEPFAYLSADELTSRGGALGLRLGWSSGALVPAGSAYVAGGRVLKASGSRFAFSGGPSRALLSPEQPVRFVDTPGGLGAAGTTLWVSVLLEPTKFMVATDPVAGLALIDGDRRAVVLGSVTSGSEKRWGLQGAGEAATSVGTGLAPALLVARIDFAAEKGANAVVQLWVDPALANLGALGKTDAKSLVPDFRITGLELLPGPLVADEIRIGDSVEAVLPADLRSGALVYEPFDYPVGELAGRGTGEGFRGPWAPTTTKIAAGAGYTSSNGRRLRTRGGRANAIEKTSRPLTIAGMPNEVAGTQGFGVPNSVTWLSFLATPVVVPSSLAVEIGPVSIGMNRTIFQEKNWAINMPSGAEPTFVNGMPGRTSLLVARIQIGSSADPARIELWVDPPLGGGEGTLPAPDAVGKSPLPPFSSIGIADSRGGSIDEIRIGRSFDAVTPLE